MRDIEIDTGTKSAPDSESRYHAAVRYLRSRERFGIKFGLQNIGRLAGELGRPERAYPSILVAGTNGKGSTAALVDSIFRRAGHRTGRYTSPHIRFLEERIQVDGTPIPREALADHVAAVERAASRSSRVESYEPTFFEAVTACAFLHFRDRQVDLGIFEVGMGGRFDATNILPAAVSVVTPIGFDHELFLGSTIEAIASEKAAIVKEGRPVVVGALVPEALAVVEAQAARLGAPLLRAHDGVEARAEEAETGQRVRLRTPARDYGTIELPLLGEHQVDNLILAVRVAELAHASLGLSSRFDAGVVREGVAATRWPGRLERRPGAPPLLLDAAHNVMAAERLARYLATHPREGRVLMFGVMKDKRVDEMLELLLPHANHFVATRPRMSRARGPRALAEWARSRGFTAEAIRSSKNALHRAREVAGPGGEVVVAGSIFLLGEIVEALDSEIVPASGSA